MQQLGANNPRPRNPRAGHPTHRRIVCTGRPSGFFGSGGITLGNIIHGGLHNLTGLGDTRLAQKLGLPKGSGSQDINPALQAHNCF